MINKRNDFIRLLNDLCNVYKDYVRDNDGSKLDVVIDTNMIKMYLYNSRDMIDEFGLTFNEGEKDKFYYISIALMKRCFPTRSMCCLVERRICCSWLRSDEAMPDYCCWMSLPVIWIPMLRSPWKRPLQSIRERY